MAQNIITPEIRHDWASQHEFGELYRQWRVEYEARQPQFIIENIRFEHDPDWRNNVASIQCAHDLNHWVWKATAVAFGVAQAAPWMF
jgi:hypothetical protein